MSRDSWIYHDTFLLASWAFWEMAQEAFKEGFKKSLRERYGQDSEKIEEADSSN